MSRRQQRSSKRASGPQRGETRESLGTNQNGPQCDTYTHTHTRYNHSQAYRKKCNTHKQIQIYIPEHLEIVSSSYMHEQGKRDCKLQHTHTHIWIRGFSQGLPMSSHNISIHWGQRAIKVTERVTSCHPQG